MYILVFNNDIETCNHPTFIACLYNISKMLLAYNTSDKELNYPVLERQFCKVFSGFWKQPICVFEILSIHSILWP